MPCLAALVYAMYLFVHAQFNMAVPPPIVIQTGHVYAASLIYSSITVPEDWEGSCENQHILMAQMEHYFNGYRNGLRKFSEEKLLKLANEWKCVE